uniref:AN11g04720 n=1 Tax=Kwoniella heveanensis TaxID=89924 RepID=D2KCD3_9TREE|nr:AN11g04720 [Kwoniella heveanensis]
MAESAGRPAQEVDQFLSTLPKVIDHITSRHTDLHTLPTLATPSSISNTLSSLPRSLPEQGLGVEGTTSYLVNSILPGILQAQNGPRYYGFVVGGVTPAAQLADILSTSYDENVQVNLYQQTASVAVEQRALELVLDLLSIERKVFMGRTMTTGATSANVLGLACARDYLYANSPHLPQGYSYAQDGPPSSPTLPSPPIIVLSLYPHFSIQKAASLVGLGSSSRIIHSMPSQADDELAFDVYKLEERLEAEKQAGRGVIVVYGIGEVNTGGFGRGLGDVAELCKKYGAWLHVDAAFGGFAGLMPELAEYTKDMDKADSLTLDGHKWLNVPYDCGLFFTRHTSSLTTVFQPPSASAPAYLASSSTSPQSAQATGLAEAEGTVQAQDVPSPLYVGIENSRRFRALPLLASLLSLGKEGYRDIVTRNILFARKVATFINESPHYELLNPSPRASVGDQKTTSEDSGGLDIIPSNIVLFRGSSTSPYPPSSPGSSTELTKAINDTRLLYVSATKWRGEGAVRIAVSNYLTDEARDLDIVLGVLGRLGRGERGVQGE